MKECLTRVMMFALFIGLVCVCEGKEWIDKQFDFNECKNITVKYEVDSKYKGDMIESLTKKIFEEYLRLKVVPKFSKKGYCVCSASNFQKSDIVVSVKLQDCLSQVVKHEGRSVPMQVHKTATVVNSTGNVSTMNYVDTNYISVPGYDEVLWIVHVNYIVSQYSNGREVFLLDDTSNRAGKDYERAFSKSIKLFWNKFSKEFKL